VFWSTFETVASRVQGWLRVLPQQQQQQLVPLQTAKFTSKFADNDCGSCVVVVDGGGGV